ncbi:sensor histidine kinase [Rhodocaloribacter sp.]
MADAARPTRAPDLAARPSFRRRLLGRIGPTLVGVLGTLCLLVWGIAYGTLTHTANAVVEREIEEVVSEIRSPSGTLEVDRYFWDEPHHVFIERRIDPLFLQVFDARGRLLRTSQNIGRLSPPAYPDRLLEVSGAIPIPRLHRFRVGDMELYHVTRPVKGPDGRTVGFVQVGRFVPDTAAILRPLAFFLVALFLLFSAVLLWLIGVSAGRVLRPLEHITSFAQSITSRQLAARVDVPPDADRETALLAGVMNETLDRLEDAFEEMRRFTSNAAHELQTPLTVLRGHVEVALRRARTPEAYRETLRLLDARLSDLTRTVRALLMLARLDRSDALPTERVDVATLVREEAEAFAPVAREKGLALSVEANGAAWIEGQPDLLREVARNLLDNAVKYTSEGRIDVRVTDGDPVVFTVTDTGPGIVPEHAPLVWNRFFRAPGASQAHTGGSGLGLSIVRQIVRRHAGDVAVTSEPGAGVRFEVRLPATRGEGPGGR